MAYRFTLKIGDHLKTPEKKKYYNQKVFTEIAPRYDFITRALSFWRDKYWKRQLVAWLPAWTSPVCVDLACGTGDIAFLLARKYPQGSIAGLDITETMLDLARGRNSFRNIRFFERDMSRMEFAAGSVDLITGGYALRNAPDLEVTIKEIRRVLKPGGVAAFLDFSKPPAGLAQRVEYWILKLWGGSWGILLHRNHEVYGYIAESLQTFPDRIQLRDVFRDHGFTVLRSRLYFFGIMELLVVRRETPAPVA
jgi:ubiquinone/menaquinone biosynthesis methyltransferase